MNANTSFYYSLRRSSPDAYVLQEKTWVNYLHAAGALMVFGGCVHNVFYLALPVSIILCGSIIRKRYLFLRLCRSYLCQTLPSRKQGFRYSLRRPYTIWYERKQKAGDLHEPPR